MIGQKYGLLLFILLVLQTANSQCPPSGIQVDVSPAFLQGWTTCYDEWYAHATTNAIVSACANLGKSLVFVGAYRSGTNIYTLGAYGDNSVLTTLTTGNNVYLHNGVYWYHRTDFSFGFSGVNTVNLNQCDVDPGNTKLCWHTLFGAGGYRVGNILGLNSDSTTWRKIILVGDNCDAPGGGGDPHFRTLDGLRYKYDGECSYMLTTNMCKNKKGKKEEKYPKFEVISHHQKMFRNEKVGIKKISINIWRSSSVLKPLIIELESKNLVKINNNITQIPYKDDFITVTKDIIGTINKPIHVHTEFGLDVTFSDYGSGIFDVAVPKETVTCGLLGNNNGNKMDDLQTKEGEIFYNATALDEDIITKVGDSWMVPNSNQPLRCKLYPKHSFLSTKKCAFDQKSVKHSCEQMLQQQFKKLTGLNVQKCFDSPQLYNSVDPSRIYDDCVTEICACKDDLKSKCIPKIALDEFEKSCVKNGVKFPVINWEF